MSDESPGMLALQAGVLKQVLPHTIDAREWAKEFNATACKLGYQVMDEGWLVAWFANAIMAGYDTATMRLAADNAALRLKVQALTKCYDKHVGTPCEQIRHQQEVETLNERLDAYRKDLTTLETLVNTVHHELVALFPQPKDPTLDDARAICGNENEADAQCLYNAYAAVLTHRQGMEGGRL